ncbi:peptidoglycan editing factor PgeF [Thermopolyspora sp. NPDC052614]|uniref:peptidoglycan editing factor PgeF n=1 Tax=Thermopolyspora sp. NPDC052614 TaxID=3155682 RepID=UPI00342CB419
MAFTDRCGGTSAPPWESLNLGGLVGDDPESVAENRRIAAGDLGIDHERVVFMRQVHSAAARYVTEPFGDDAPELDAVCTDVPGLALAVLAADCAPVLIADPDAGVVGAAHSGRVGTLAGVVPALVKEMTAHGASTMVAVVGPMACGRCYEVPADMRDRAVAVLPETGSTTRQGTPALDLRAGIVAQLRQAGVQEIHHDARCTIEDPDLYSHRREVVTGRQAGYVWLEP